MCDGIRQPSETKCPCQFVTLLFDVLRSLRQLGGNFIGARCHSQYIFLARSKVVRHIVAMNQNAMNCVQ